MASLAPAEKRALLRMRPRGVVSLAMYQGERIPPAYGILNDISEGGLCVQSDRILARGQDLHLRIQFAARQELFEAEGRVAWTKPSLTRDHVALSGIAFAPSTMLACDRLRRVLVEPDFEPPSGGGRQFDDFMKALTPYLEKLGLYLTKLTRH